MSAAEGCLDVVVLLLRQLERIEPQSLSGCDDIGLIEIGADCAEAAAATQSQIAQQRVGPQVGTGQMAEMKVAVRRGRRRNNGRQRVKGAYGRFELPRRCNIHGVAPASAATWSRTISAILAFASGPPHQIARNSSRSVPDVLRIV